ncbi:MAG TPA: DUF2085 domain-containing protein [Thermoplasmatales archaeon]|nr:DUF2085 domain-containing protein [Thermoplasmatales archaeon]
MHLHITSRLILLFFVLAFIFFVLQVAAPVSLPASTMQSLSGCVGVMDNGERIREIGLPWNIVYEAGDLLCHQKSERSFFINGNQMPFCSRCTAIWFGLVVGLGVMVFYRMRLSGRFVLGVLLGLVPIGVDGFGQLFGLWDSTNLVRVLTGLPAGFVCGVAVGVIVYENRGIKN